jgi:hypothetical protein
MNAVCVGDQVKLPSGAVVLIMARADAERPWTAVQFGQAWQVGREAGWGWQYYSGGKRKPAQLAETDARALAEALNAASPAER